MINWSKWDFKFRREQAIGLVVLSIILVMLKPDLWVDALDVVVGFLKGLLSGSMFDSLKHLTR